MKGQKISKRKSAKKINNLGITLIALVITIIVMLILAGVSLNATIGENGVITQARRATYMQSAAVLQDWFHQKYVDLSTSEYVENGEVENTPLAKTLAGLNKRDIIFRTSEGYCFKKPLPITLEDGTPSTQTYVFYLIVKDKYIFIFMAKLKKIIK